MKYIDEAGRVFQTGPSFSKRGAPDIPARAFDAPGRDRSVLPKPGTGKYVANGDGGDEGDYYQCLVTRDDFEIYKKYEDGEEYYGINVLFFKDGSVSASCDDKFSKLQWLDDKAEIIKVAKNAIGRDALENFLGESKLTFRKFLSNQ